MFNSLVENAKLKVSSAATRAVGRVVVGILLLVAIGFAIAAGQIALAQAVGALWACLIMAGLFVVLAIIAAIVIVMQQREQQAKIKQTSQQSALLTSVMSASPSAIMGGVRLARLVGRRAPLLMVGALAGGVLLARQAMSGAEQPSNR